jgi:HD-GYP domain-containing protein (c-di-GMP phosphodiesterase class II)
LIITPFTGFLYTIDESNIYSRGPFLFTAAIIEALIQLTLIIYLWVNRKNIHPKKFEIVYGFVLFPLLMQILQIATNGIALVSTGFSISFILMFIVSQHSIEASLDYREVELAEKEVELLNKVSESQQTKFEIIKMMQNHTIESLSNLVENRDEDTGEHVVRTRAYVEMIAIALMKKGLFPETITPKYISLLKRAAPMHDIGKIVVPDAILKKPGRFTEEEFNQMKKHVSEGGRIVHEIMDGYEDPEYIQITVDIATHHHERWDGTGYPSKLKGQEIPLCARIMALADVFDALVSPRVYKSPMSYNEAFGIIEENKGKIFDPVISQEFLNLREKAIAINESFKEK